MNKWKRDETITVQCVTCGDGFHPWQGAKKPEYCSRACRAKAYTGEKNPRWKGGGVDHEGYRIISINGRRVREHRHVIEQLLNRRLHPEEVVHHRDGDRLNNDPRNLELLSGQGYHRVKHCANFRSNTHKQCARCHEIKPRTDFHKRNESNRDPHRTKCKACELVLRRFYNHRKKALTAH